MSHYADTYDHPYHQPTHEVFELYGHDDWDWDLFAVFRNKETNQLTWDHDSGCSCYGPFEFSVKERSIAPIRSMADLEQALKDSNYLNPDDYSVPSSEALSLFRDKIRTALRRKGAR